MDVGQSKIASGVAVGELFVVETHQVHHGGMQVVHVDTVFDSLVAELVGPSLGGTTPHSTTGHPDTESVVIVVTAGGWCC